MIRWKDYNDLCKFREFCRVKRTDLFGLRMLNGKMVNSMQQRLPTEILYNIEKRMGGKKSKSKKKMSRRKLHR